MFKIFNFTSSSLVNIFLLCIYDVHLKLKYDCSCSLFKKNTNITIQNGNLSNFYMKVTGHVFKTKHFNKFSPTSSMEESKHVWKLDPADKYLYLQEEKLKFSRDVPCLKMSHSPLYKNCFSSVFYIFCYSLLSDRRNTLYIWSLWHI